MGVINGHTLLYSIVNLSFSNIIAISKYRNRNAAQVNVTRTTKPVIDFDVSWIAHQSSKSSTPVQLIISLALIFAKEGFEVCLVCDGTTRHHTKRATILRTFKKHQQKTSLLINKCKYSQLTIDRQYTTTIIEHDLISSELQALKEKIQMLDSTINPSPVDVRETLDQNLFSAINELTINEIGSKGGVITLLISEFQADYTIAYRSVNKSNDITLCADNDQAFLSGEHCSSIKNYKLKNNRKLQTINNFEIFATNKTIIEEIANVINLPLSSPTINTPCCPLLEGINELLVRTSI